MQGSLRIRCASKASVVGRPAGPLDPWLGRLVKLVPGEVVAVYLGGRAFAEARFAGEWPLVCLVLVVVVRAWSTADRRGPQWISVGVAASSFVLWVHAMGGRFLGWSMAPDLAALGVLVWTTLVPVFWRGDEQA